MIKNFVMAVILAAFFCITAQASEGEELKHFQVVVSSIPSLQNSTNTSVPGHGKISDTAYQYQFNYINQPTDWNIGPIGQRLDYYSLRAIAYKHAYTDVAEGVASVQGLAFLYGQRYLLATKGYQGFGLGWYAGLASVTDTWVEKCCGSTPIEEQLFIPVAAAELFYKFNITPNFYIEPGVTFAWQTKGDFILNTIPVLLIGGEF